MYPPKEVIINQNINIVAKAVYSAIPYCKCDVTYDEKKDQYTVTCDGFWIGREFKVMFSFVNTIGHWRGLEFYATNLAKEYAASIESRKLDDEMGGD